MKTYKTKAGETWDHVALKVYGHEKYADYVMSNNYEHLNTLIFKDGTVLNVPDLPRRRLQSFRSKQGYSPSATKTM